jgi:putative peptidoglycan lipid II flippase
MAEVALTRQRTDFWGAALSLSMATLLTRAATFIIQIAIALLFGASAHADAYFAAENVLLLVGNFVVIGFGAAFIPLWMEYQIRHSEGEAHTFANAFITLATGATIFLALAIALAAPVLMRLVAPGFSRQTSETATQLLATMAPAVALLGLTAGCTGLLEAHRRFVLPELSRVAYRVVILIAAVTLSGCLGVMALAWGTLAGSLVRLMVQLPNALKFRTFRLTHQVDHQGVRRALKRALPIFIAFAGLRVSMLLGNAVASWLPEGAVSGLTYAGRVMLLPVGLLALPLRTTIFPTLSQHVAEGRLEIVGETAMKGLRTLIFVTVPVCAGLVLLRAPLIQLLFQRGEFDTAATHMTAGALGWYALGLPAIGGMLIVNSIYFALGNPIALAKFNLIYWTISLGLSLALVRPLGLNGIALSISLSTTVIYALAVLALKPRLPGMRIGQLGKTILKACTAAGWMTALLLGLWALLPGQFSALNPETTVQSLIILLVSGVVGAGAYGVTALALQMEEAQAILKALWRRLRLRSYAR